MWQPLRAILREIDQLEAAAAEIASDAVGIDEAHHDALGREARFGIAGQNFDLGSDGPLALLDEVAAVLRIANRGCRDDLEIFYAQDLCNDLEAGERGEGPVNGLDCQGCWWTRPSGRARTEFFR